MVEVIDKRGKAIETKFKDLEIGQCFQDCEDRLCMKVSCDEGMAYRNGKWWSDYSFDDDDIVLPLKTTITIERE